MKKNIVAILLLLSASFVASADATWATKAPDIDVDLPTTRAEQLVASTPYVSAAGKTITITDAAGKKRLARVLFRCSWSVRNGRVLHDGVTCVTDQVQPDFAFVPKVSGKTVALRFTPHLAAVLSAITATAEGVFSKL